MDNISAKIQDVTGEFNKSLSDINFLKDQSAAANDNLRLVYAKGK